MESYINALETIYDRLEALMAPLTGGRREENPCGSCVQCCRHHHRFPVSALEREFIRRQTGEIPREYIAFLNNQLPGEGELPALCPHSRGHGTPGRGAGCRIYDLRPLCCRLYGFSPRRPLAPDCVFKNIGRKTREIWPDLVSLCQEFSILKLSFIGDKDPLPKTLCDHLDRGQWALETGDLPRARLEITGALGVNPDDPVAHGAMGDLWVKTGDIAAAIKAYVHALDLDPLDFTLHVKLGQLYGGSSPRGRHHFQAALDLNPPEDVAFLCRSLLSGS